MTSKDYIAIASVFAGEVAMIKTLSDGDAKRSAAYSVRNCVLSIADKMAQDNARFRRQQFYKACGLTYDTVKGWWI